MGVKAHRATEPGHETRPRARGTAMRHERTLKPIPLAVFDAAFPKEWPVPLPKRNGWGTSDTATAEHDGETYGLTRVSMPNGEQRRFAVQYNGYMQSYDQSLPTEAERLAQRKISLSFGCAWSPVAIDGLSHAYLSN